jgi:hypothetical protein
MHFTRRWAWSLESLPAGWVRSLATTALLYRLLLLLLLRAAAAFIHPHNSVCQQC